jgi:pyrroline-5-carboxylate reductase
MESNSALMKRSEIIVLAVKPQGLKSVLEEIAPLVKKEHTLISIVASVPTSQVEKILGKSASVLRAMPNTPAFVQEGITAISPGQRVSERDWQRAESVFRTVGRLVRVDESQMNGVTGLSGCGPAYVYMILEALTEAGIKVGIPRDLSSQLAAQTVLGSAKMLLETGRHPAALKDEVTTPAGCTIDGLMELEEGKLRVTLIKAVVGATKRARLLARQFLRNS